MREEWGGVGGVREEWGDVGGVRWYVSQCGGGKGETGDLWHQMF